jgi:hypothetical protein
MEFEGASEHSAAVGATEINRKVNFIDSKGTHIARSYSEAVIKGLYDGVDLHLTKENGSPRFDLVVAPNHSVSNILVNYRGANGVTANKDGTLSLGTSLGEQRIAQLRAFQSVGGQHVPVDVKFDLHSDGLVGFKVGKFNSNAALVIDPIVYSTLMGDNGQAFTQAFGVGVGADSAPVITGTTDAPDFPVTVGAYGNQAGNSEAFITKFTPDGSHLEFSTLIGCTGGLANGVLVQVDSKERVVIAGYSQSGYPLTGGAVQTTIPSGSNFAPFVSVLSADGSKLLFSTYYSGGFTLDSSFAFGGKAGSKGFGDTQNRGDGPRFYGNILNLQLDSSDKIYLIGEGTITPTKNAYQSAPPPDNTYVTCFNTSGSIFFATYFGGLNSSVLSGAVGQDGGIYFCGDTTTGGISSSNGAFQTVARGYDGFVTKLNPVSGSTQMTRAYTTFLGGSGDDICTNIAVNAFGEAYVLGQSGSVDFPITTGAWHTGSGGGPFAAKFDAAGASLEYATYTGIFTDTVTWMTVDQSGNMYITGSANLDVPFNGIPTIAATADQKGYTAYAPKQPLKTLIPAFTPGDAFLIVINPTGTGQVYGSFWGGTYDEEGEEVTVDSGGNCYMVGWTDSFSCTLPGSIEFPTGTQDVVFDNEYFREPAPPKTVAPWLYWNTLNADIGPLPVGFLTKFRVTGTPYLTGLGVPRLVPGGTSGFGSISTTKVAGSLDSLPVEVVSSNQNVIPSITVNVPEGTGGASFPFKVADVTVETALTLTAYHDGVFIVQGVQVVPLLQNFSVSVPTIVGGNSTTARVYLSEAVPTGASVTVTLTSSDPVKAKPTISSLVIHAGQSTGLVNINTVGVDGPTQITFSAQVTANTLPNSLQQVYAYTAYSSLTIMPASVTNVQFSPQIILGGNTSAGAVVLNGLAGPTPIQITLSEIAGTAPVTLSATKLTIPSQSNTVKFSASTAAVFGNTFKSVQATQGINGPTALGTLFVNPIVLSSLDLLTPTVTGGSSVQGYVTLSATAPSAGVTVTLSSSNSSLAKLSTSTVTVPSGAEQSGLFTIQTPVTNTLESVSITAVDGPLTRTNTLTIEPETLSLTASPAAVEGGLGSFSFGLSIGLPEQNAALTASLSSNGGSALSIPASETLKAGQTSLTFSGFTNVVSSSLAVTVTASIPCIQGKITTTKVVTINPLALVVNVVPNNIIGGVQNGSGSVVLSNIAKSATVVTLKSSNSAAASPSPSSITIPVGGQTGAFTLVTNVVAVATPVTITATDSNGSNSTSITVSQPQVQLTKLQIAAQSILGGLSTTGTLSFTGLIPKVGLPITLASNSAAVQVSSKLTLQTGTTSATFPITTSATSADIIATISATYNSSKVSSTLTVVANRVGSLSLSPNPVTGGNPVSMTVSINVTAPAGGLVVSFSQSSSSLSGSTGILINGKAVPVTGSTGPFPTVTIPAGQSKVVVTITTPKVSRQLGTSIQGIFGQFSQSSVTLLVNP